MSDSILKLMQNVDAFFPIGAFTLSNGLEDYVERNHIKSIDDLDKYLKSFINVLPYQDLGILSLAYDNYDREDEILKLDNLFGGVKGAIEVRTGNIRMCTRYMKVRGAMNNITPVLSNYFSSIEQKRCLGFFPIALGIYGRELEMDKATLMEMFAYSIVSSIVNNSVKLVPLSHLEGQRVLYKYLDSLSKAAKKAEKINAFDIGISGACYDIHCMNHEKLYSRQFMS